MVFIIYTRAVTKYQLPKLLNNEYIRYFTTMIFPWVNIILWCLYNIHLLWAFDEITKSLIMLI